MCYPPSTAGPSTPEANQPPPGASGYGSSSQQGSSEHDPAEQRVFTCSVCSRNFNRLLHLQRHEYIHSDFKPFQCPWCPKSFTRQDSLVRHARLHCKKQEDTKTVSKALNKHKACMSCTDQGQCSRCAGYNRRPSKKRSSSPTLNLPSIPPAPSYRPRQEFSPLRFTIDWKPSAVTPPMNTTLPLPHSAPKMSTSYSASSLPDPTGPRAAGLPIPSMERAPSTSSLDPTSRPLLPPRPPPQLSLSQSSLPAYHRASRPHYTHSPSFLASSRTVDVTPPPYSTHDFTLLPAHHTHSARPLYAPASPTPTQLALTSPDPTLQCAASPAPPAPPAHLRAHVPSQPATTQMQFPPRPVASVAQVSQGAQTPQHAPHGLPPFSSQIPQQVADLQQQQQGQSATDTGCVQGMLLDMLRACEVMEHSLRRVPGQP